MVIIICLHKEISNLFVTYMHVYYKLLILYQYQLSLSIRIKYIHLFKIYLYSLVFANILLYAKVHELYTSVEYNMYMYVVFPSQINPPLFFFIYSFVFYISGIKFNTRIIHFNERSDKNLNDMIRKSSF